MRLLACALQKIILLFKSVFNYLTDSKSAMVLQLKVQRTELTNAELMISDLTEKEKEAVFEFIQTDHRFRQVEHGDATVRKRLLHLSSGRNLTGSPERSVECGDNPSFESEQSKA